MHLDDDFPDWMAKNFVDLADDFLKEKGLEDEFANWAFKKFEIEIEGD